MSSAMKFFIPEPRYLDQLTGIARVGAAGNRGFLVAGVGQIEAKARRAPDLPQRNRLVFDGLRLLKGDWRPDLDPDPFDVVAMEQQIQAVQEDAVSGAEVGRFLELAREAKASTWPNFDAFAASEVGLQEFDRSNANCITEFDAWYRRYRSYLVLGLPDDVEAADKEANRRIEWMVAKIAPTEGDDPWGMRRIYLDDAWFYARDKFAETREESVEEVEVV